MSEIERITGDNGRLQVWSTKGGHYAYALVWVLLVKRNETMARVSIKRDVPFSDEIDVRLPVSHAEAIRAMGSQEVDRAARQAIALSAMGRKHTHQIVVNAIKKVLERDQ